MPALSLSLDEVDRRLARAPLVPVFREILSDALTPVTAYRLLAESGPAFLLESVEGGERLGRYSFVAADPLAVITVDAGEARVDDAAGERALPGADPFTALEGYLAAFAAEPVDGLPARFCGGAVGYLAYESVRYMERVKVPAADPLGVPDGVFLLTDTLACFETQVEIRENPSATKMLERNLVELDARSKSHQGHSLRMIAQVMRDQQCRQGF